MENAGLKNNPTNLESYGDGILRARDLVSKGVSRKHIMEMTQNGELLRVGRERAEFHRCKVPRSLGRFSVPHFP